MDYTARTAALLYCVDCELPLTGTLVCPACSRSFSPEGDGVISALPKAMAADQHSKDEIHSLIEASGPGAHGEKVVLYERAFHDEQASYYDSLFADPLPMARYYRSVIHSQVFSYLPEQPCVVDLCCGTGKSSLPLLERGAFVVAIDVSREMLRVYRKKCLSRGLDKVIFIHADASRPPLKRQSCAAIMMIGGLHHIRDQEFSVHHCSDALAPGGLLILHEPLKTGVASKFGALLENLYALSNPGRVWRAIGRRLGMANKAQPLPAGPPVSDFTPFEQPFSSMEELLAIVPKCMSTVALRSQGALSFREFPSHLQGRLGIPLAWAIVKLDGWLSRNDQNQSGDALFAVFRKT